MPIDRGDAEIISGQAPQRADRAANLPFLKQYARFENHRGVLGGGPRLGHTLETVLSDNPFLPEPEPRAVRYTLISVDNQ